MTVLYNGWLAIGVAVGLIWLLRHRHISLARREDASLAADDYRAPAPDTPLLSVIVPARNEEKVIDRCVQSLVDQDYPNLELIFIDDRSEDATGQLLRAWQEKEPGRVRVLTVEHEQAGWFGKANAVQKGVDVASGRYLLFSDADCEQTSRHTLSVAMRFAADNEIDCLTITPVTSASCFWEAIIQPVCVAVLMYWHPPRKVNDPNHRAAYANGAFMLFHRDAYERIGGHEQVRTAICEDMALARNVKGAGMRLYVAQNRGLYTTQMYDTFGDTWRGWNRIFQGSLQYPRRVVAAMTILSVFSLLPWLSFAISLVVAVRSTATGGDGNWVPVVIWGLVVAAQQSTLIRFYHLLGAPRLRAMTYFGGAILCFAILANTFRKLCGWGATVWRGRAYVAQPRSTANVAAKDKSAAHV